jgi:hypothetical protein
MVLSEIPYKVKLLYSDDVLVQLDNLLDLSIELIIELPQIIPGYDLWLFMLVNLLAIGIIIFLAKKEELYQT